MKRITRIEAAYSFDASDSWFILIATEATLAPSLIRFADGFRLNRGVAWRGMGYRNIRRMLLISLLAVLTALAFQAATVAAYAQEQTGTVALSIVETGRTAPL